MLTLRKGSLDDLELLSHMNRHLIEDEQHDNPLDISQLKGRMRDFLTSDYNAYLFCIESAVVGYALVDLKKDPPYLRHFFICREARRHGYGKLAFYKLLDTLSIKTIEIEVFVWNDTGRAFWQSLGFKERSISMRLQK
jgi:GNAT superfamily N-acetyltransferase